MSDDGYRTKGLAGDSRPDPLSPNQESRRREQHVKFPKEIDTNKNKHKKKRPHNNSPNRSTSDHHHHPLHHHHHHHRHRHHSPKRSNPDKEVSTFVKFTNDDKTSADKKSRIRITANTQNSHQDQARDLDEAFRLYFYAERAALRIQQAFRERQREKELMMSKQDSDVETEKQSDVDVEVGAKDSDEDEDKSSNYTMIFLAIFTCAMIVPNLALKCYGVIKKCFGGDDTGGADAIANATMPQGGGGAGGGGAAGPAPTGGEAGAAGGAQAGAQGAMAAQAASSAASGAASGVASGAAAGAAASSAAAAAGATAAAAGATQVATVVAVSTAAVAATSVAVANSNPPEPILSICGLANPDIRSGRMVMLFEGLPRPFDARETGLVENLVMESYNELTLGSNVAETGCLDPLAREMQSVAIVNQTLFFGTGVLDPNKLEVVFEAQVSCDRCSDTSPLFSEEQAEGSDGNRTDTVGNTTDSSSENATDFDTVANVTTQGIVMEQDDDQSRLLLSIDFTSQKFFQKLIQLVIVETEELADEGELPEGFVQISKALVVTSDVKEEETLVTEIKYKRQASTPSNSGNGGGGNSGNSGGGRDNIMATFEFEFVDESGQVQKETVDITDEGAAIPTTAFPTFQPSHVPTRTPSLVPTASPTIQPSHPPTDTPSDMPTNVFSGQPTQMPSTKPSGAPSGLPSQSPSDAPSLEPSGAPSQIPSLVPSDAPSDIPSESPSEEPSSSPSMLPSMVPSFAPSEAPSEVPSFVPSEVPSSVPSFAPSEVPSYVPSASPSDNPSAAPSPSPSAMPTQEPSSLPTGTQLLTVSGMATYMSSNNGSGFASSDKAIDGNASGNYALGSVAHTNLQTDPWWQVDLGNSWGGPCVVKWVTIWNRSDCCWERLYGGWIQLLDSNGAVLQQRQITSAIGTGAQTHYFTPTPNVYWVKVILVGANKLLQIAELQAWGYVA